MSLGFQKVKKMFRKFCLAVFFISLHNTSSNLDITIITIVINNFTEKIFKFADDLCLIIFVKRKSATLRDGKGIKGKGEGKCH